MDGIKEIKYPIYVISKGRHDACYTADILLKDGVPFHIVVEPQERDSYFKKYGNCLYVLPFKNLGKGSIPARNWVKTHSTNAGDNRHWILDDNINYLMRRYKTKRVYCSSKIALAMVEIFTDRYTNIALSGLNQEQAILDYKKLPPFYLNCHVYSCILVNNAIPHKWRGKYNEDTDLCLQVLSDGWCTVNFNAFMMQKPATMTMKGGNTDELYKNDGRLEMSRELERNWPKVVSTKRRFKRPQHYIYDAWKRFDTPLERRTDIDWDTLQNINEFGMELKQVASEIKSKRLKRMVDEYGRKK